MFPAKAVEQKDSYIEPNPKITAHRKMPAIAVSKPAVSIIFPRGFSFATSVSE
jgi:hypothetical protein